MNTPSVTSVMTRIIIVTAHALGIFSDILLTNGLIAQAIKYPQNNKSAISVIFIIKNNTSNTRSAKLTFLRVKEFLKSI